MADKLVRFVDAYLEGRYMKWIVGALLVFLIGFAIGRRSQDKALRDVGAIIQSQGARLTALEALSPITGPWTWSHHTGQMDFSCKPQRWDLVGLSDTSGAGGLIQPCLIERAIGGRTR